MAESPEYNDSSTWRANKGYRELVETKDASGKTSKEGVWTERGTLAAEELEKAVFALNPGEVSDIIQTPDALYVAKLEEKKTGTVRPFEDLKVQADIRDRMEKEQRTALRYKEQVKLRDAKYWSVDKKHVQLTVDMAMQKYSEWARANSATSSTSGR
jgi:peptidyl-prolyl cis-trans isomerase D